MSYTLDEFGADCRRILKRDPGPDGREKVRAKLEALLGNDDFVAEYCGPDAAPGRRVIFEDPELGFQILAHVMQRDHVGSPHDHGPSWAIYGQAVKHTDMTEWTRLDDGAEEGRAELSPGRKFRMERGRAAVFNEGRIHSIAFPAGARFIRVTGTDLDRVERLRFDPEQGIAIRERRASMGATA